MDAQDPAPPVTKFDRQERDARIGRARKWLLWISVITLLSGFFFYALAKQDCEKQIAQVEAQLAGIDPDVRDARMKQLTGMTWEQAKAHDRNAVTLLLVLNIGLAGAYVGLWFWARRNVLKATVTALGLFVTVIVVNGVYEPSSLYQGFIVKIFFILALSKAISAALEERRLQAAIPAARLV
jgi:hypothetical protein